MNPHIKTLQADLGIAADGVRGPITDRMLMKAADEGKLKVVEAPKQLLPDAVTDLPWMAEAKRLLGRHESRDNGWLKSWLKSDGKTLGDPAKLPWCGDFVETCIRLALPGEPFPGALGQNPYWARNWLGLGVATSLTYGAILVFERGPSSGHVGFAVGQDDSNLFVLGGNQSNAVTVARLEKRRLLGARWPSSYPRPALPRLAHMKAGGPISTNEV